MAISKNKRRIPSEQEFIPHLSQQCDILTLHTKVCVQTPTHYPANCYRADDKIQWAQID
ncbi:MAG: hypothetical protein L3J98_12755 [Gammaproteobacteria bacterium]|nr:hypothetical protein [Gammaproteobacteria bacterium]MCF6261007.1 hypothetical protein [Gammaproteobacteria bacterium]